MFQSTRPRGARPARAPDCPACRLVSIHAPAWGATPFQGLTRRIPPGFNPRARVGRDGPSMRGLCHERRFQSTRPRGARPPAGRAVIDALPVSIHAPAWGATSPSNVDTGADHVSIHAPAWGATRRNAPGQPLKRSFNPRARVGRDPIDLLCNHWDGTFQSTRPRGARRRGPGQAARSPVGFNPRARVGRDLPPEPQNPHARRFQSTRPRGARRSGKQRTSCTRKVSIHAPAWGATSAARANIRFQSFQSTRPRGARRPSR